MALLDEYTRFRQPSCIWVYEPRQAAGSQNLCGRKQGVHNPSSLIHRSIRQIILQTGTVLEAPVLFISIVHHKQALHEEI
jgi:hypothetical protein